MSRNEEETTVQSNGLALGISKPKGIDADDRMSYETFKT